MDIDTDMAKDSQCMHVNADRNIDKETYHSLAFLLILIPIFIDRLCYKVVEY